MAIMESPDGRTALRGRAVALGALDSAFALGSKSAAEYRDEFPRLQREVVLKEKVWCLA